MQHYRITAPFVALEGANGRYRALKLEPGDTIALSDDRTTVRTGIVKIVYDGLVLSAYQRDIQDRAEQVEQD